MSWMDQCPWLKPLSPEQQQEIDAFHAHVAENVVPEIVKAVEERERNAVKAREMILF